MIQFILLQAAILLGIIASFVLPYVRKVMKGEIAKIDPAYIYHLVITALWQFIISFAAYSSWRPPKDVVSGALVLLLAFFFGFGGSDMQKEAEKFIKQLLENRHGANVVLVGVANSSEQEITTIPPPPTPDDVETIEDKVVTAAVNAAADVLEKATEEVSE